MGILEDVFQMEGKECKYEKKLKCEGENLWLSKESVLTWDRQLCLGHWQWTRRVLWQPREIHRGRKGEQTIE